MSYRSQWLRTRRPSSVEGSPTPLPKSHIVPAWYTPHALAVSPSPAARACGVFTGFAKVVLLCCVCPQPGGAPRLHRTL